MKMVVISSCTGKKINKPENILRIKDFKNSAIFKEKTINLAEYEMEASKMYTGSHHLRLMEGINILREKYEDEVIDLYIISAGYGLLHEKDRIVPYEVTFNTMNSKEIKTWGKELNITEKLQKVIKNYDLVIFLLGTKYLKVIEFPLEEITNDTKLIFITNKHASQNILNKENYFFLEYGQNEAREFKYGNIGLKGYLMKLLCYEVAHNGREILYKIYENPKYIKEVLKKYKK